MCGSPLPPLLKAGDCCGWMQETRGRSKAECAKKMDIEKKHSQWVGDFCAPLLKEWKEHEGGEITCLGLFEIDQSGAGGGCIFKR